MASESFKFWKNIGKFSGSSKTASTVKDPPPPSNPITSDSDDSEPSASSPLGSITSHIDLNVLSDPKIIKYLILVLLVTLMMLLWSGYVNGCFKRRRQRRRWSLDSRGSIWNIIFITLNVHNIGTCLTCFSYFLVVRSSPKSIPPENTILKLRTCSVKINQSINMFNWFLNINESFFSTHPVRNK